MNTYVIEWYETPPIEKELAKFELKISKINIHNDNDCKQPLKNKTQNKKFDPSSQICAGLLTPNPNKCDNDYGSFLFNITQINDKKKYVLLGILTQSSDERCDIENKLK